MKVNLGSGYTKFEDYINIDGDPLTNPDYVVNLEKDALPLEDDTVTDIRAHHIFEHIGEGYYNLMKEIYRVCKDGAIIDIAVPHHRSDVWYGDPSHVRFITVDNLKQFSKSYNNWHIETYNSSSGFGLRLDVDFEIVDVNYELYDTWKTKFQSMSQEECNFAVNTYNNVIGYVFIKLEVIKHDK